MQFEIEGEEASDWVVVIREDQCTVEEGNAAHPTLTFSADSQDFLAVINGELDGMKAFMTGKLKLVGDLSLAMKLLSFFELEGDSD